MKKGISDATFIPKWDYNTFFKTSRNAGFRGVELNFREAEGELNFKTTAKKARELLLMAKKYDLEIASLSTGLFNYYALSSDDKKLLQYGEEIGRKMIELAHHMEVKVIQMVPGVTTPEAPYQKLYNIAMDTLSRLAAEASTAGVTIGIENVCNKFLSTPLEFVQFIDDIGHPSIKAYFDNANASVTGYPEQFIDLLGERIIAVHLKDYRKSINDFVPILDGDTNWPMMIRSLKELDYTGYMIATPHYPYKYCPERCIVKYSQDLDAVLQLA